MTSSEVAYFYLPSGYYDIYIDSTIIGVMATISPIVTEIFMAKFGRKTVCIFFLFANYLFAYLGQKFENFLGTKNIELLPKGEEFFIALIIQSAGEKGKTWMGK